MKKNTYFLIILIIFFYSTTFAQKESSKGSSEKVNKRHINEIQIRIAEYGNDILELKNSLKEIRISIDLQNQTSESIFKKTSLLVSIATYGLAIISGLITIGAFILGLYIRQAEKKIINIRDDSYDALKKINKAKSDVLKIREDINSNLSKIYQQFKRQETVDLIERLNKVPGDIENLISMLLSRDLKESDYELLKQAYLKVDGQGKELYCAIFYQHFMHRFVLETDPKIIAERRKGYSQYLQDAFDNDLVKSSQDFINGVAVHGLIESKEEINEFLKAVDKVKPIEHTTICQGLFKCLKTFDSQVLFYKVIDDKYEKTKTDFGKQIINEYLDKRLSGDKQKQFFDIQNKINE